MRHLSPALLGLCLVLVPVAAMADEAVALPLTLEEGGEDYLDTLRFTAVDADVVYYDPAGPLPPLDTPVEPPPPDDPEALPTIDRTMTYVVAGLVLLGVALVIYLASGSFTLSLDRDAANPARAARRRTPGEVGAGEGLPADLQAILRISDRRQALVLLAQAALSRTVAAQGILFQPSWTLRDALRHIPRGQVHLDALRGLVLAGERVLFGNRDVTEDEFQAHVAQVRPLMSGMQA